MEKGVNEITHSKAFAQGVGYSRCSGNPVAVTNLLVARCLVGLMAALQTSPRCFLYLTKGWGWFQAHWPSLA